jgi:NADH-quinone oxidoreductase subunit J
MLQQFQPLLLGQVQDEFSRSAVPILIQRYWPVLLPAALGLTAIYLLLPRARRYPPLYGAVAAALAMIATGWLLIRTEWVLVETILFFTFAGLAILFGGMMITQRNPVHAALAFAVVVLSTCGLFLLLAAPFLMAATIIIYAGAIVVTFLFVIMLAQQAGLSNADQRSREPFLASVAGFVLLASILCILQKTYAEPVDKLDSFIAKAEFAAKSDNFKEWQQIFGDDGDFFKDFRQHVTPTREFAKPDANHKALSDAIQNAGTTWSSLNPIDERQVDDVIGGRAARIKLFKIELVEVCQRAVLVRQNQGSIQPESSLPLSNFAGAPANAPIEIDEDGKPKERIKAANVAGLGKALFTDYLLAVELAGTLLLVATIGAIAIAGRRAEGLR